MLASVAVWALIVLAYLLVGVLFGRWVNYAFYFQTSLAAKILIPLPPFDERTAPFGSSAPTVDEKTLAEYGNFKRFSERRDWLDKLSSFILWPVVAFPIYAICTIAWLVFLLIVIAKGVSGIVRALSPRVPDNQ